MANVNVSGLLNCSDGTVIPLSATLAEATESNLTTNTTYTVAASNVGDFAPGKTVTSATIQADHNISYAYILRQGLIAALLPVSVKGSSGAASLPLCAPITLQPGDIVRCLANATTSRQIALSVYTNRGVSRIFVVTPSTGATNKPVDLQTGNSLGDTLQGSVIVKGFCSAGNVANTELIDGGGVLAINEKGIPVGGVPANTPINSPLGFSACSIPVALNYEWAAVTSA